MKRLIFFLCITHACSLAAARPAVAVISENVRSLTAHSRESTSLLKKTNKLLTLSHNNNIRRHKRLAEGAILGSLGFAFFFGMMQVYFTYKVNQTALRLRASMIQPKVERLILQTRLQSYESGAQTSKMLCWASVVLACFSFLYRHSSQKRQKKQL